MKKILFLLFLVTILVGCSDVEENNTPKIEGVNGIECIANSTVDLLNGVIAYDQEDGDITPQMQISITPHVEINDGYVIFDDAGTYKITYSVTDSNGNNAIVNSDITVVERETFFDFSEAGGFYISVGGQTNLHLGGIYNGKYIINATNNQIAEDVSLNRVYNLSLGKDYVLRFNLWTENEGRIRILINGVVYEERWLDALDNEIAINYSTTEKSSFTLSILLGDLGEKVNCQLKNATIEYEQGNAGLTNILEGYTVEGRFDGTSGSASFISDNKAKLKITQTADAMWRGGMFINTNIEMEVGVTYEVSFKVERQNTSEVEVAIQNKQWDEKKYDTLFVNSNDKVSIHTTQFTVTNENKGYLWLYIQSGKYLNEVIFSEFEVKTYLSGTKIETIMLNDFYNNNEGYNCQLETFPGGFSYFIETFADVDYQQKVTSPQFHLTGSGKNYIISFKAKATKPVEVIFAGPVVGGWDPTLLWHRITIGEEEKTYTFAGGDAIGDKGNVFVWQFGSYSNKKYSNVRIEISDIQIHYRNSEYDGD